MRPRAASKPSIAAKWRKIIQAIPGYDPIATATAGMWFDAQEAQRYLAFFTLCLRHVKGSKGGEPLLLEWWQQAIVANIFGWKRAEGTRRYREVFLYVARKNGKTPLCAGIVLAMLTMDHEPGAEMYSAAADRDQAALVYAHARGMVLQEEELDKRLQVYETAKSIVFPAEQSAYKVISADANTKHGYNSQLVVIDELHAQPKRDLVDVLMTSTGARRQPLIIHATTADFERPSICNEKYEYAKKVQGGVIEDASFLPVIYEADVQDDFTDPKVWRKANPNLGVSISEEYLQRECKRAQETPSYLNTFLRLHLNIKTAQDVRWLPMDQWQACGAEPLEPEALLGARCYGGLDLASTSDLCAFVLYFPDHDHAVLPYFWVPQDTARERDRKSRVPYLTWAREGYLTLTPGNITDYNVIEHAIVELAEQFDIQEIAFDRWNANQLVTNLMGHGLACVAFGQGFASMSAPSKELERLLAGRELRPGLHPVLQWNASNVQAEYDAAGNIKPSKAKSSEKIDGIVALIMALGRAIVRHKPATSVYETRGVLVF